MISKYIEAQKNISLFSESLGSTHISILQYLGFKIQNTKKKKNSLIMNLEIKLLKISIIIHIMNY